MINIFKANNSIKSGIISTLNDVNPLCCFFPLIYRESYLNKILIEQQKISVSQFKNFIGKNIYSMNPGTRGLKLYPYILKSSVSGV